MFAHSSAFMHYPDCKNSLTDFWWKEVSVSFGCGRFVPVVHKVANVFSFSLS